MEVVLNLFTLLESFHSTLVTNNFQRYSRVQSKHNYVHTVSAQVFLSFTKNVLRFLKKYNKFNKNLYNLLKFVKQCFFLCNFQDENSCDFKNGGCSQICEEEGEKFLRCRCYAGYKLADDKRTCYGRRDARACECLQREIVIVYSRLDFQALDPCRENKGHCQHHCVNDNGRVRCQCYPGYRLGHDRKSCIGFIVSSSIPH